jgi:hypothetical protein
MKKILVDGGYSGSEFQSYGKEQMGVEVEEIPKKEGKGFQAIYRKTNSQ